MKRANLFQDTIAWRVGTAIVVSMVTACCLIGLFFSVGGVWSRPPVDEAARMDEASAIISLLEAAPANTREKLAQSVIDRNFRIDWFSEDAPRSIWLKTVEMHMASSNTRFAKALNRRALVFAPGDALYESSAFPLQSNRYPGAYYFAVELSDNSWVIFTGFSRYWGLTEAERYALWGMFFLVSFAAVPIVAARQVSRPIRRFAAAVRRSGASPHIDMIPQIGPKEIQDLIGAFNEMHGQIRDFIAYRVAMLAAISHDLRTPLTRIRLRGELISDKSQRARLFKDVDEMQAMIDGALGFFRGDANEERSRAFDLADILQSIKDDFADHDIDVDYLGPTRLIYVGRPLALKRAFTNLIENAAKYGINPRIVLACHDKVIVVKIRDHGIGIPPHELDNVFEPFYRLDKSRNRTTGGVGLGLTSSKAIIRSHGGKLSICNHVDGGLEVTVLLFETRSQLMERSGMSPLAN